MLVTLYPGAGRDDVLRTLREIESAADNANQHSGFHGWKAYSRLTSYLEWATTSVRLLEHRVSAADLDRLVCTRGYERLVAAAASLTGSDIGTQRVLNGLVDHEINQRTEALQETIKDLDQQIRRWPKDTTYTVADTSVYIEHDGKLRDLHFTALRDGWPDKPVVVIVPLIILDELDGLKQRGGDATTETHQALRITTLDCERDWRGDLQVRECRGR